MKRVYIVVGILGVALIALWASTFTVAQNQLAIKLQLGDVVASNYKPGLHFKIPFYNTVRKFDKRILTMDAAPDKMLTIEKKNVIVDAFVKWRIVNTVKFFNATGGDEQRARERLHEYVKNQLYNEIGKRKIVEVVSGQRSNIMQSVQQVVDQKASDLGVKVVDVRIKKVELPDKVLHSVYQRMRKERNAEAARYRALGHQQAKTIRAKAQRKVQEIKAQAYRQAQEIRGEGDAAAAKIYAKAYKRDPEFYAFYRSLEAYKKSFNGKRDVLVLSPDSEFFDYFDNSQGRSGNSGQSASAGGGSSGSAQ